MTNWFPIRDYEGLYEVSSEGEIRNVRTKRILKPAIKHNGYKEVVLRKNDKSFTHSVHRLVAIAYIPNPKGLPCVKHKDEDKLNCDKDNLEWCTYSYNNEYSAHQRTKKATLISPEGMVVKIDNIAKFSKSHGLSSGNLCNVINGKLRQTKGWRLANE